VHLTRTSIACLSLILAGSAGAADTATDTRTLSVGWLMFGDLYYVPSYHDDAGENAAGAVLRRAYLTFDADVGASWFGRLRLEANQSGEFEDYDVEVGVKDLYAGRDFGKHRLLLGKSPTPAYDLIENAWGLRYLARTPMDLQGLPSRDTGIALRGPLSADGRFGYRVMLGAGSAFGTESGDGRKLMTAVSWQPDTRWTIDLIADYEVLPGDTDRRTLQGFVGFASDVLRWGLQYSHQDRQEDSGIELASAYVIAGTGSRSNVVLRVDRLFEPSAKGEDIDYLPFDPSAEATMLIAGFEYRPADRYYVTPNVVVKRYDEDETGQRPGIDVHLRLSFFLDFE
jgi:hypothetical protein